MVNYAELRRKSRSDRHILGLLSCNTSDKHLFSARALGWSMVLAGALFIGGCIASNPAHAEEYSDKNIVNAIRKAEGTWTYGIKSVTCQTEKECRQICKNTVKKNRIRFSKQGRHSDFIIFLAERYCPINAENDPTGLNHNWIKNVRFFLGRIV